MKNTRIKLVKNWSLNTRMRISYLMVIILFAILLAGVISSIFATKWKNEMGAVVLKKVDLIDNHINMQLGALRNIHENLLNNQEIQNYMLNKNKKLPTEQDLQTASNWMLDTKNKNANVISCLLVDQDGTILDTRMNNAIYENLLFENIDFQYMKKSKSMSYISAPSTFPLQINKPSYRERNTMTYYGRYYDDRSYKTTGYLLINWKKSGLFEEIDKISNDTFEYACVTDKNGEIFYQLNEMDEDVQKKICKAYTDEKNTTEIKIAGRRYLLYQKRIREYPNWRFQGLISYDQMNIPVMNAYVTLIVITFGMFLIVAFISTQLASGITRPIDSIVAAMRQMGRGIYPEPVAVKSHDEMKQLADGFNAMVLDIHNLQDKITQDQIKQKEIDVAMMKSKLDLLQSQINPHFIHNTLNTMKYMAQIEGNYQLVLTITAFNTLLRTSMNTGKEFITVSEEMENINHYLEIQKQRYDVPVKIRCFIYDNVDFGLLPKLILQPLVENSLFHGIVPKGGGTVKIVFRREKKNLSISVSDDGVGIPTEKQKSILKEKKNSQRGYNNIGLANVNERLQMYYGLESELHILSSEEFGTFISFLIPFEE